VRRNYSFITNNKPGSPLLLCTCSAGFYIAIIANDTGRLFKHLLVSLHPNLAIMIQKTFGIYSERNGRTNLAIETGEKHLACWCTDADSNVLQAFEFFQFQYDGVTNDFSEVYRQVKLNSVLLTEVYEHVKLVWENSNCVCVPATCFEESLSKQYLDVLNGDVFTQSKPMHYTLGDRNCVSCRAGKAGCDAAVFSFCRAVA